MLKTSVGSELGFDVKTFLEGKTYDIKDNLAKYFIEIGNAKEIFETKMLDSDTYENKAQKKAK